MNEGHKAFLLMTKDMMQGEGIERRKEDEEEEQENWEIERLCVWRDRMRHTAR